MDDGDGVTVIVGNEVHVATEHHALARTGRLQELQQARSLQGVVTPLIHALLVGDDLDTRS